VWQDLWFIIKAITLIKTQNNKKDRQKPVSAKSWVHSQVSLVFMVVEGQWDRFVPVLQLSVASISLQTHHSHLLICQEHQITFETDSITKWHILIKIN
jgi:hypothetical protein